MLKAHIMINVTLFPTFSDKIIIEVSAFSTMNDNMVCDSNGLWNSIKNESTFTTIIKRALPSIIFLSLVILILIGTLPFQIPNNITRFLMIIEVFNYIFIIFVDFLAKEPPIRVFGKNNNGLIVIPKLHNLLLSFSLIFTNNEKKIPENQNKMNKKKRSVFQKYLLTIFIVSLSVISIVHSNENQDIFLKWKSNSKKIENVLYIGTLTNHVFKLIERDYEMKTGFGCEMESITQGRSYLDKSINISYCFFSRSSVYSGNGGVIYVSAISCSMRINFSMFYNCVASNNGAIFFSSSVSCLRNICSNKCSGSWNQFAYILASEINQIEYLSVSFCSTGSVPFGIKTGNQSIKNTNSSMNTSHQASGVYIDSPTSSTISHCTFSNNQVVSDRCISFFSNTGTISMLYANIVHNNSPSYGVVFVHGSVTNHLKFCIFQNNQNYLFCVFGGSLEVTHSFIDHSSSSFSTSKTISTATNNTFASISTYQIQFFNSHHCFTDNPLPMRSVGETFSLTIEESLKMTFKKTIDQTIRETPIKTLNESPMNTYKETLAKTLDITIRETLKETIPRTNVECIFTYQMAIMREINVLFSFSFKFVELVLIIS